MPRDRDEVVFLLLEVDRAVDLFAVERARVLALRLAVARLREEVDFALERGFPARFARVDVARALRVDLRFPDECRDEDDEEVRDVRELFFLLLDLPALRCFDRELRDPRAVLLCPRLLR